MESLGFPLLSSVFAVIRRCTTGVLFKDFAEVELVVIANQCADGFRFHIRIFP